MLQIPWLMDQELPAGLSPKEDWQTWAKGFIDPRGSGLRPQRPGAAARPSPSSARTMPLPSARNRKSVVRRDAQGQEAKYSPLRLPANLYGQTGRPDHARRGHAARHVRRRGRRAGRLGGKEIYAASKPLAIMVKDVPQEGRPDELHRGDRPFPVGGRVGAAAIEGGRPDDLHPDAQRLRLAGRGEDRPNLGKIPAVAARFKVYEATQKTEADAVAFRLFAPPAWPKATSRFPPCRRPISTSIRSDT